MRIKFTFYLILLLIAITAIGSPPKESEQPSSATKTLQIIEQQILINGKSAKVFNIVQPDGTVGYVGVKGQYFDVTLQNKTNEWVSIHWHGLINPNSQDGVPYVTQQPIAPGGELHYKFPLIQSGTFLMRSYYKLQQQNLLAAPLIIRDPNDNDKPVQDVVMFLQDFTFGNPKELYPQLRTQLMEKQADIKISAAEGKSLQPDTIETKLDAYLTNRRTLSDPDIIRALPDSIVRLRVINAATNTNFFIDLGSLTGKLVAVDSEPVEPLIGTKFQLAQGQRAEIEIVMPAGDNSYPILAQAEGTSALTGLVLATPNAIVPSYNERASYVADKLDYSQENNLIAVYPLLPQDVSQSYTFDLDGNMLSYIWTMNGEVWPNVKPLFVKLDQRIELILKNKTALSIPIHLHGHVFQVVEINGKRTRGAVRDTILVLPYSTIKVHFDADNPGIWLLHGFIPFQTYGGMTSLINYENYSMPIFNRKDTGVPPTSLNEAN